MSDHDALTPKMKPISPRRSGIVCALDIGTSKVACLIARLKPRKPDDVFRRRSHSIEVLGIGHTQARGVKAGMVVDIGEAEDVLRHALDAAERMAGVHIDSVILPSPRRDADELYAATSPAGADASDADIERVLTRQPAFGPSGRAVVHSLPIARLDEQRNIRDPRGMLAAGFGVDMHVVTTACRDAQLMAVERCHLGVEPLWLALRHRLGRACRR